MWQIERLPFVWSHPSVPTNAPLPDMLPFHLDVDAATGRLIQRPTPQVRAALADAYRAGSIITGAMAESGIGRNYADDFLKFVLEQIQRRDQTTMRILEVGCGNGFFAKTLAGKGHQVVGIDPGPQLEEAQTNQLTLLRDFFPSVRVTGQFELVLAYALLEHLESPEALLRTLHEYLVPDGFVILAVPDCAPPIALGDPSMLVHEHYAYFSAPTLTATLELSGYDVDTVTRAGFGGMLYGVAHRSPERRKQQVIPASEHATVYVARAQGSIASLVTLIEDARGRRDSIGIVVPGRAINSLAIGGVSPDGLRFFDDNPLLAETYYPPFPIPIEPTENLRRRPVDLLMIMSQTFGGQIAARLRSIVPRTTRIVTMTELYAEAHASAY